MPPLSKFSLDLPKKDMKKLLECIPNFSEGRNLEVIRQITAEIERVEEVQLLDVDPGASTNRTVVTFVGEPEAVVEAAFLAIKKAAECIDMRQHSGTHPRMGATDVCPLVPISNISVEEAVAYANKLAKRVGEELEIPVYLYEKAAKFPVRTNLATIRAGEYEGFAEKIYRPEWKPDYGPAVYNAKAGQTVIGVRDFLIAYNVNINSTSVKRANNIAFDVREKGRIKTDTGKPSGTPLRDNNGNTLREPGACKAVKAIGWYVEEYGIAQISMNLTNIRETPLHKAFVECVNSAHRRGMRVTGSEIVGLVPLASMLEAGRYFLKAQNRSTGVSDEGLIHIAVKSMGLDELAPFDPKEKIIEYKIASAEASKLARLTVKGFSTELASESPAPGGGSVAALAGALGAALGTMVANLSANKRGWEEQLPLFSEWAEKGQALRKELIGLIDRDTAAFNAVMAAYRLPKGSEKEKAERKKAIEAANKQAAAVPLEVMETAFKNYALLKEMAETGNPNSITDVGVGVLCTTTAIKGAALNVRINLPAVDNQEFVQKLSGKSHKLVSLAEEQEQMILAQVEAKMKA